MLVGDCDISVHVEWPERQFRRAVDIDSDDYFLKMITAFELMEDCDLKAKKARKEVVDLVFKMHEVADR